MGKAAEVDIVRAQLKLLIVHGDMQKMEAYPVAYYNIIKTKDGIACRPVAQEVIGRAAFLLVFAALVFVYVIHTLLPLLSSLFSPDSTLGYREVLTALLASLPIPVSFTYYFASRLHVWAIPISPPDLEYCLSGEVVSRRISEESRCYVLPAGIALDSIKSQVSPVKKLVSYLSSPVAWFFLIGTAEAVSLLFSSLISAGVFFGMMSLEKQAHSASALALACGTILILFIGMLIARYILWAFLAAVLKSELGQEVKASIPISRWYFCNCCLLPYFFWCLYLLVTGQYTKGDKKPPYR
jgi:hypothetical protein